MKTRGVSMSILIAVWAVGCAACGGNSNTNGSQDGGLPDGAQPDAFIGPDGTPGPDGDLPSDYEGFGAVTQGAEGCPNTPTTVYVTTLDDDGSGSLREALSDGCRTVVFDEGGTITLQSNLRIRHSHITVDGLTAPSPGITIVQPGDIGTVIEASSSVGPAHDIIIRYLRMDGQATAHTNTGDIWGLDGEAAPVYNVILDHITARAATDGVFDIWAEVHDVTISWNLITDTVTALHLSEASTVRERISIHHNVFAQNNERQIRIKYDSRVDFVNNVVYGWGWMECAGRGLNIDTEFTTDPTLNVINNLFHDVVSTPCAGPDGAIVYTTNGVDTTQVYMEGNIVPAGENDTASTMAIPMDVPAYAVVTTYPADSLATDVVPHVGTHFRTAGEQSLLDEIQTEVTP